jgi:hypothetical protein
MASNTATKRMDGIIKNMVEVPLTLPLSPCLPAGRQGG